MFNIINTKSTTVLVVVVIALAAAMALGPVVSSFQSVSAHYGVKLDKCKYDDDYYDDNKKACDKNFKKHDNDDGNKGSDNKASQAIGQSQSSSQNSQCVSGDNTDDSCNNISLQNQENTGNNALAQDGNGNGGNKASQAIGQSQSSSQNSQCVSGDNTDDSCNNISLQNQENTGNNALAQQ